MHVISFVRPIWTNSRRVIEMPKKLPFSLFVTICAISLAGATAERTRLKVDIVANVKSFQIFRGEFFFSTSDGILRYDQNALFRNPIGKKGQGPGELENFNIFGFIEGKIYICDSRKIAIFCLDGRLDREWPNSLSSPNVVLLPNNAEVAITSDIQREGSGNRVSWIKKITFHDLGKSRVTELLINEIRNTPGYDFEGVEPIVQARYCERSRRIYISDPSHGLINVYSETGEQLAVFRLQLYLKPIEVNDAYKNEFFCIIFQDPRFQNKQLVESLKRAIHFSRYFPLFHSFYIDEAENILVRTFQKKGNKLVYCRLNSNGIMTGSSTIDDRTFDVTCAEKYLAFYGGAIWQLFANGEGDYFLERFD